LEDAAGCATVRRNKLIAGEKYLSFWLDPKGTPSPSSQEICYLFLLLAPDLKILDDDDTSP
jgi:hypothetical protein